MARLEQYRDLIQLILTQYAGISITLYAIT